MTDVGGVYDTEMEEALKVLMGENTKKDESVSFDDLDSDTEMAEALKVLMDDNKKNEKSVSFYDSDSDSDSIVEALKVLMDEKKKKESIRFDDDSDTEMVEAMKVLMDKNTKKEKSVSFDDSDSDSIVESLKVLMDEKKKKEEVSFDNDDPESNTNRSPFTMQIVDAFDSQNKDSITQKSMLIEAIKKQNELLSKIISRITEQQKKQEEEEEQEQEQQQQEQGKQQRGVKHNKPIVVYRNENENENENGPLSHTDEVVAAIAAAEAATNKRRKEIAAIAASEAAAKKEGEEAIDSAGTYTSSPKAAMVGKKVVVVPRSVAPSILPSPSPSPVVVNKKQSTTVINKSWAFVESNVAMKRRNRVEKGGSYMGNDDMALFGKVDTSNPASADNELRGDSFGKSWNRMSNRVDRHGKLKAPKWSTLGSNSKKSMDINIRSYLPKLAIGGETKIQLNSGVYYLTMKYENGYLNKRATPTNNGHSMKKIEAAIIIGEIAFDSKGFVVAPGADMDKLFKGSKRQLLNPPRPRTKPNKMKWYSSKVSDPWQNGDTIRFKINTVTNTLGYTLQGKHDKEVRSGWSFQNLLAFTNNHTYPDYFQVFAYCGGTSLNSDSPKSSKSSSSSSFENVKFNIIESFHRK